MMAVRAYGIRVGDGCGPIENMVLPGKCPKNNRHSEERRNTMPTFNQLVRKGREQVEYKSTAPALQKGFNSKKKEMIDLSSPQSARLHYCPYLDPQKA